MGRKFGSCAPIWDRGHLTQCGQANKAYLHVKFHLDLYNRLATVHHRQRPTDRQTDRQDMTDRTDNGLIA